MKFIIWHIINKTAQLFLLYSKITFYFSFFSLFAILFLGFKQQGTCAPMEH